MINIDKRALREAAEKATGAHDRLSVMPADDIFDISLHEGTQLDADITDLNSFNEAANPETVLALLDELEAAEKRIAEHRKVLNSLAFVARRYLPDYDEHPEIQAADELLESAAGIGVKGE